MTPEFVTGFFLQAIKTAIFLAAPMLAVGLIAGVLVSMFQAATQINEMTLVFVPKMLGVALALLLTGTTLSVMSFIGMMVLVGVGVNNGIVLVDYINRLRSGGMARGEALLTALPPGGRGSPESDRCADASLPSQCRRGPPGSPGGGRSLRAPSRSPGSRLGRPGEVRP